MRPISAQQGAEALALGLYNSLRANQPAMMSGTSMHPRRHNQHSPYSAPPVHAAPNPLACARLPTRGPARIRPGGGAALIRPLVEGAGWVQAAVCVSS